MRVRVDRDRCIGSGMCVLTAPEVFDQHPEDGTVLLREEYPPPARHPVLRDAVARCPAAVISLDDADP